MKRCDTEGCERDAVRTDVPLCGECWLAFCDFLRDHAAEPDAALAFATLDDEGER